MSDSIILYGISGKPYRYWPSSIQSNSFKNEPGNYAFAKQVSANKYFIIYVGETSDLSTRFSGHHAAQCIRNHGVTHILTHTNTIDEKVRRSEETDLIRALRPPCNNIYPT